MVLDLTEQEREYLLELLDTKSNEMLHEIHHTDARDFKEMLKARFDLVEGLRSKLGSASSGQ